jgi:hypothetical protein
MRMFTEGEIHFFQTAGISLLIGIGVILFVLGIIMTIFALIQNFKERSLFEIMPYYRDNVILWLLLSFLGTAVTVFTILYFV